MSSAPCRARAITFSLSPESSINPEQGLSSALSPPRLVCNWHQTSWVQIPPLPFTGYMTLGKAAVLCASVSSDVEWE